MRIKYLAHASFLATAADGTRVQFDPYEPGGFGGALKYGKFTEPADAVVISHDHADHSYAAGVPGNPTVIKGAEQQTVRGLTFRRVRAYHDSQRGGQRGENIMTVCEMDGVCVCHVGDLGHVLSDEQAQQLGGIDVLLLPVGGYFTIDAAQATEVMNKLAPRVCIPMHYKTARVNFPIAAVDDFLKGKANVKRLDRSEVELMPLTLPTETEVWVLEPAL